MKLQDIKPNTVENDFFELYCQVRDVDYSIMHLVIMYTSVNNSYVYDVLDNFISDCFLKYSMKFNGNWWFKINEATR